MLVARLWSGPQPTSHRTPPGLSTVVPRSPGPSPTKATTPRRSSKPGTAGSKEPQDIPLGSNDANGVELLVGGVGNVHTGGQPAAQIFDDGFGDHLAGQQGRNAGRVGADRF